MAQTTGPERFLVRGRLESLPRRQEDRRLVLRWLAARVSGVHEPLPERELTERLAALVSDPVGRRRDLVDAGLLTRTRDGAEYWRTVVTEFDGAGPDSGPATAPTTLRVMTWNVWWRFGAEWPEREPRIHAVAREVAPDLLALQETWRAADGTTQADELARTLGDGGPPYHAAFATSPLPPEPAEPATPHQAGATMGVALVSRWPIVTTAVHPLPARHREPPTALLATVEHPRGPLHVVVACTEWEAAHADDHLAQLEALAALVADPALDGDLPVLLLGDLNAPVDGALMAPLVAVADDLWPAGGGAPDAVTLPSRMPAAPLGATAQLDRRIDHVLARAGRPAGSGRRGASAGDRVRVERSALAGDGPVDGVWPSDHVAVVCDVVL